jgi:hypothetical protein
MRKLLLLIILCLPLFLNAQFTYSGYIRNADGTGAVNFPVKLYRRTVPNIIGFTSQQNYNGHSYYRSTGNAIWTVARQNCINMGGHLVTVTTSAENSFIFGLWPSGWIGLTDEVVEGVWQWVTGEAYSYTSWNPGEPNNAGNEDYIQFVGGGKWNDLPNNVNLPYVLEFEYIVTTTAWSFYKTVYTNSSGYYSFSEAYDPSKEYYIQLDVMNPATPLTLTDIIAPTDIILSKIARKSIHFNLYDVNGDNTISISDAYFINKKRYSMASSWPGIYLYTPSQYTSLTTGTADLRSSILGVSSITINSPVSGTTTGNYYIIAPGFKGQVSY